VRAVVQRVTRAEIRVDAEVTGRMERGLLALIGVARGDTPEDVLQMSERLVHLRVFPDEEGRMNRSLLEVNGTLGVVSQFTLLGDCRKGRRPSYVDAAPPEEAEPLIELLVETVRQKGVGVVTGRFRAKMDVDLLNDGPVTLLIDSRRRF
jgi:D-tyrosyl-tRNA(Tyr) deacylase